MTKIINEKEIDVDMDAFIKAVDKLTIKEGKWNAELALL